jgi:Uncharacterised protein domain (DUF2415)
MLIVRRRFHESKTFVKPQPKSLYPVRIPLQHYQLRHFISTTEDGRIYYAAGYEVYALHLATGKRERISSLDFPAQCLGAAFGWVCVGGQTGRCVFIDVRERSVDVDALLPLNLDPNARMGDEPQDLGVHRSIRPRVYPHTVCNDYINSISLFRIPSHEKGIDDEEVALVSTNDHSVEVFSLRQLKVLTTLSFPVNMNHASISPDGNLMVACGDYPRAYFLRRVRMPGHIVDGEYTYGKHEWKEFANVRLMATEPGDTCFSTAFSPSGHVCTVASQFGVVTVFDVSRICDDMEDDDAVIDSFTSSRPAPVEEIGVWMPGAVRSSAFSPEPWDLFAWAEDRGRVCIADMRDGFRTRQLIDLDPLSPEFERCEITDVEEPSIALRGLEIQASLLRRQRDLGAHDELGTLRDQTDYVENAAERRRRRELASNAWSSSSTDLTETERQILETLRVERLADAANNNSQDDRSPLSIHYSNQSGSTSRIHNPNMSVQRYIRERSAAIRDSQSSSRSHGPRRRSSVVISGARNSETSSADPPTASSSAAHPSSLAPITGSNTLSTSPSRLATATSAQTSTRSSGQSSPEPDPQPTTSDQAWRTISAIANSTEPSSPDRRARVREVQRQLLIEDQQNHERRRQSRQRELDEARAQVLALNNAALEAELDGANAGSGSSGAAATSASATGSAANAAGPSTSAEDGDGRSTVRLQRELTRRQQVEQLLAEYRVLQRQGIEAQERSAEIRESWTRAERGLDQVRLQQLRRLQERAQLAEERLPGVAAAAAVSAAVDGGVTGGLAYLRNAGELGGLALERRRERGGDQGVAVMGLGWSNDGRTL